MNRPFSLTIVAGLFILAGAGAGWQTITHTAPGHIFINPVLLSMVVGIGLLHGRQFWRYVALACIWMLIFALVISSTLAFLFSDGGDKFIFAWSSLPLRVSGTKAGLALMILVLIWMRWVLVRKDVRDLFTSHNA